MDVIESLKAMYFSFLLSSNALLPNVMLFEACKVKFCKLRQPPNAEAPILRRLLDKIVTDTKLSHHRNALRLTKLTPFPIVTFVKLPQLENASI